MLYTVLATLFLPLISRFSSRPAPAPPKDDKILNFELRHYHAVSADAHVAFSDAPPSAQLLDAPYTIRTRNISTFRPPSFQEFSRVRSLSRHGAAESLHWDEEEIPAPDVESRQTLLLLAKMTNNAYVEPDSVEWYKLDGNWTVAYPFGWEPDADGFKGHVFATPDNGTVVLSIKGTSGGIWNGGGPTAKKDKLNDNLLFSCCCARVGWSWTPVCGCWRGDRKCHQDCLEDALIEESLFYPIGTNLYNNLTYMYPDSNIWVIGHSMGGSLASLLGATFGPPVVAFEAPGEKLAATRLHLPSPPSTQHIIHVYNTADPIAMGTCNGVLSTCSSAGYAMETSCHLGKSIVYDTVSTLGWYVNIGNHGIVTVVNDVLGKPWPPSEQEGKEVPEAKYEKDCMDCYSWEYGDFP
ncbi:alpha/beta-hydrolase [Amanita muscaria]